MDKGRYRGAEPYKITLSTKWKSLIFFAINNNFRNRITPLLSVTCLSRNYFILNNFNTFVIIKAINFVYDPDMLCCDLLSGWDGIQFIQWKHISNYSCHYSKILFSFLASFSCFSFTMYSLHSEPLRTLRSY